MEKPWEKRYHRGYFFSSGRSVSEGSLYPRGSSLRTSYQVHESAKMLQAEEALAKKEERKYWNVSEQTMMDLF